MRKKYEIIPGTVKKIVQNNKSIIELTEENKREVTCGPDAYVGQKVEVLVKRKRKGNWLGEIRSVLENAPNYVPAKCKSAQICGGCTLQNISYEDQLKRKLGIVALTLNIENDLEPKKIIPSPTCFHYRNKMEYTFGDEKKDGPLTLGLHRKNRTYDIITADDCQIVHEDFNIVLRETLKFFAEKELPYYNKKTHKGFLKFLIVRRSEAFGNLLVNIVTTSQEQYDFSEYTKILLESEANITGILNTISDSISDAVKPDKTTLLHGEDFIYEEILGLKFKISPFSFFQTNPKGAELLYKNALDLLSDLEDKIVFDLYSGTGSITQIMALKAKQVYGIELVDEAVIAARENAALNGLDNCEFISGDVLSEINQISHINPDIIVLDPPRNGVGEKALSKIVNFGAKEILYISCKASSLARDIDVLKDSGYKLEKIFCLDMFPQTVHVETVALFVKI
ncbi:MAG: 23S rRNA (uracil-5-)-methyltransferase RumA [Candidatus Epulonipiscioides saccharophilum]|nr:MAG: 23S rRNA (uracil-5-)-methyltransferase RumA [Epulopiscium sp. AS2M-Bin001]